jgi:hypothetical protein
MSRQFTRIPTFIRCASLVALAGATASCGDLVRSSRSPVQLVVNSLASGASATMQSDVVRQIRTPDPCSATSPCPTVFNDSATVTLSTVMKDASVAPTTNNQVTVTRYHVQYRRADGRNTPGVDVPFGFDGGATGTIVPGGTLSMGFEIVRHTAKLESPLIELRSNPVVINTIADVTFFGSDQVGNDLSVTASMLIDFGDFGDTP